MDSSYTDNEQIGNGKRLEGNPLAFISKILYLQEYQQVKDSLHKLP